MSIVFDEKDFYNKWITGNSLEWLERIPDNSIPCILTDVPYDFPMKTKLYVHNQFLRISSGVIIVFSPPENQWILPADQYLFWEKPISTKNTSLSYSRFVEMIFIYGRLRWNCKRHWSQYTNIFKDLVDDTKIHAYRKPPSLIERLIRNHTNEGDLILDPFAGSGVVREVAMRLNRPYCCIEQNENLIPEDLKD